MKDTPLVSFCMPVHNAGKYLEQTLEAVLKQEYGYFEVIVVNDRSTDNSAQILADYSPKIVVLNAKGKGASAARNQAFLHSKGDYIIFFDADDLISPGYLSSQVTEIVNYKNSVVIAKWGRFYGGVENFKEDPNLIKSSLSFHDWILGYWMFNNHMTPPGRVILPRHIVNSAGLWDESLSLNDDFDFFARIFNVASKIVYNDSACFYYRSGVGGISSRVKGYEYQQSNFRSIDKATRLALERYVSDEKINRACANVWQLFVYENYPENSELRKEAIKKIDELGGADFPFPSGGLSAKAVRLMGWKLFKRIKKLKRN
jgi:glycosyltransferase involved in cell wall biosynthesis